MPLESHVRLSAAPAAAHAARERARASVPVPRRLVAALRDNPLAIAAYVMLARSWLHTYQPVPLSPRDLLQCDPSLSRGSMLRALARLLDGGWLVAVAGKPGSKPHYLPAWGSIGGTLRPWDVAAPGLGRPSHVAVLRLNKRPLDAAVGYLDPHPRLSARLHRATADIAMPGLSLRELGTLVLHAADAHDAPPEVVVACAPAFFAPPDLIGMVTRQVHGHLIAAAPPSEPPPAAAERATGDIAAAAPVNAWNRHEISKQQNTARCFEHIFAEQGRSASPAPAAAPPPPQHETNAAPAAPAAPDLTLTPPEGELVPWLLANAADRRVAAAIAAAQPTLTPADCVADVALVQHHKHYHSIRNPWGFCLHLWQQGERPTHRPRSPVGNDGTPAPLPPEPIDYAAYANDPTYIVTRREPVAAAEPETPTDDPAPLARDTATLHARMQTYGYRCDTTGIYVCERATAGELAALWQQQHPAASMPPAHDLAAAVTLSENPDNPRPAAGVPIGDSGDGHAVPGTPAPVAAAAADPIAAAPDAAPNTPAPPPAAPDAASDSPPAAQDAATSDDPAIPDGHAVPGVPAPVATSDDPAAIARQLVQRHGKARARRYLERAAPALLPWLAALPDEHRRELPRHFGR